MSNVDILKSKDSFLRNSFENLKKAAELAKEDAIRTNTGVVFWENGKVVHVSAEELRKQKAK